METACLYAGVKNENTLQAVLRPLKGVFIIEKEQRWL